MHRFNFKKGILHAEDVRVDELAEVFGTPFYLYSHGTIVDHFEKIDKAFRGVRHIICYSMKANSNLAFLKTLVKRGAGLDIVSGGELFKALKVECSSERIVYASVGKKPNEIRDAIKAGILFFNVESFAELSKINEIAGGMKKKVKVALRLNPNVEAKTHKYITTGKSENKFGLDFETAKEIFLEKSAGLKNVAIKAVHVHIGSQITEAEPFQNGIRKTLEFLDANDLTGRLEYFNIGGGLGIVYGKEKPQTAENFAKKILPFFKGRDLTLILEPGRFIAGNSGILVAKVVYIKKTRTGKYFAIVDAGMNDLIRPSLYEAYHSIVPVIDPGAKAKKLKYDVVGPICESGDFFAKDRDLSELKEGDLIAVMGAGAYGFSMSSNYNSRPRINEIMVIRNKAYVVREGEKYSDLIRGENIPEAV